MARDYTEDMKPDTVPDKENTVESNRKEYIWDIDGDGISNKKDKDWTKEKQQAWVDKKDKEIKDTYSEQQSAMNDGKPMGEGAPYEAYPNVLDLGVNDVPVIELTDEQVNEYIDGMDSVPFHRKYKPIGYNERSFLKETDVFRHRRPKTKYTFRIGDSIFYIPPQFITVSESSSTVKESSLRSVSTSKKKYGFSTADLTIKFVFNGSDQINGYEVESPFDDKPYYVDGLRPFLAQCRVSPIIAVENEFLNRTCGIYSIVIQNVQVTTVPNFPKLLECTVMATEFDSSILTGAPIWEYSNIIEWDLYRYNYQRLLTSMKFITPSRDIEESYQMRRILETNINSKLVMSVPDDESLYEISEDVLEAEPIDMKKIKYTEILNSDKDNFEVLQISFGFENITTSPKLSNHSKPTIQYLGGGDSSISLAIITKDPVTAGEFKSLIAKTQYLIKKLKGVSGMGFAKISNQFLELVGTDYMLIDSVNVETVPDFPGLYSISVQACSHDMFSATVEDINGFKPFPAQRDGKLEDCIDQDLTGLYNKLNQDLYTEYKMNEFDLYPDLMLPTYNEINAILPLINNYRESKGIVKLPYSIFPARVAANTLWMQPYATSAIVDPDYYFVYPQLDLSKSKVSVDTETGDLVEDDKTKTKSNRRDKEVDKKEEKKGGVIENAFNAVASMFGNLDNIDPSMIKHIYKVVSESSSEDGGVNPLGENNPPSGEGLVGTDQDLLLAPGPNPLSCSSLNIRCSREIDRKFLDCLLAKNGCGYVFGANGQICFSEEDARYTQVNEDRLRAHGRVPLDKWRGLQAFDCSGFVGYGMYYNGYYQAVPRVRHDTFKADCLMISKSEIRPGDLLFNGGHIAVAIGGDKTIEAMSSAKGVIVGNVGSRFSSYGRLKWTPSIINSDNDDGDNTNNEQIAIYGLGRGANDVSNDNNTSKNRDVSRSITRTPQVVPNDELRNPYDQDGDGEPDPMQVPNGDSSSSKLGKYGDTRDRFDSLIIKRSDEEGLDPNWVKALMTQESGMNPTAGSSAGAKGLMQITSPPCQQWGFPYSNEFLHDPDNNIMVGCKYLKYVYNMFPDYQEAVGAYNCGQGAWASFKSGAKTIYTETKNHIIKITKYHDTLIANGGVSSDTSGAVNKNNSDLKVVPKTKYILKEHGERKIPLKGSFGVPFIIESPLNYLRNIEYSDEVGDKGLVVDLEDITEYNEAVAKRETSDMFCKSEEIAGWITKNRDAIKKSVDGSSFIEKLVKNASVIGQASNLVEAFGYSINEALGESDYNEAVKGSVLETPDNSLIASVVDDLCFSCRGTMLQAFPTYSLMISADNSTWFDGKKLWTNHYPYRSVVSIAITHDFEQPTGTAVIRATNLNQNLTRRPKLKEYITIANDKNYSGMNRYLYKHYGFILGTSKVTEKMVDSHNNIIQTMKLEAGTRVHIRMGYGNCFSSLPVVFNGAIAEIGSGEFVDIVAQSDGTELINNVISNTVDKTNGMFKLNKEHSNVITSLLIDRSSWVSHLKETWGESSEYNIEHFGLYVNYGDIGLHNRELQYDIAKNIYLGHYKEELYCSQGTKDIFDGEKNIEMFIYNKTSWDTMNTVAQSLPEFVVYPTYHGFESRLFFGLPDWFYKYRYDINENMKILEYCKTFSQLHLINMNDIIDNKIKASSKDLTTNVICSYVLGNKRSNDVETTATLFSDKTIDWSMQKTKVIDTTINQDYIGWDAGWEFFGFNQGVTNAEAIAVSTLLDSYSKMYYDEVICLGKPSIKPYDNIFIDDLYGEMYGLARVNRVTHNFSADFGFTTSIVPGLLSYNKTEDSGSTNIYRNRLHLMDLVCSLVGGRFLALEAVNNYANSMYLEDEEDTDAIREYFLTAIKEIHPVLKQEEFLQNIKNKSEVLHEGSRKEYITRMTSYNFLSSNSSNALFRHELKALARFPLTRKVMGYFAYGNSIGIRPLLHKSKPFVTGIKGSRDLMDGYGEIPYYENLEVE